MASIRTPAKAELLLLRLALQHWIETRPQQPGRPLMMTTADLEPFGYGSDYERCLLTADQIEALWARLGAQAEAHQ
jgi:hypothetical protein